MLTANLSQFAISFGLGLLSDKFKIWKLLIIMHSIFLTTIVVFATNIPEEDHIYTKESPAPLVLPISFTMAQTTVGSIFTLNLALQSKAIANCTTARGVLMGAQGFVMSLGTIVIDGLGGPLYDSCKRNPFFIVISGEALVLLVIFGLRLAKELHI